MRRARIAGCRIDYNITDGCAIVRPEGACDARSAEALASLVNSPVIRSKHLVLDLSRVEYIETPGYRWILKQLKQLELDGRKLVVAGLPPSIERIFRLLRLHESIPIAQDIRGAVELIESESRPQGNPVGTAERQ
ncbi:MAG: STAS domain-containing protein [Armatimonadota bacterium]|nr:STAS domain-containing protein [Armatimonadota bacterium]